MARRLGWVLWLWALCGVAWAQDLSRADELARWGAYFEADRLYREAYQATSDPGARQRILVRRLAVAEILEDGALAEELIASLQAGSTLGPEVRLSIALARANLAVRRCQFAAAARAFQEVTGLAAGMDTPAARMALYQARSFGFWRDWEAQGRPRPETVVAAFSKAWEPVAGLSPTQALEPLEMMRAAQWGRKFWIYVPAVYCGEAYWAGDTAASAAWYGVARSMADLGRASLIDRAWKAYDAEASSMATHYALDVAEHFYLNPAAAQPYLDQVDKELRYWDGVLAQKGALGQPLFVEQQRLWARYHRAKARLLGTGTGWKPGTLAGPRAEYEQSLRLFSAIHQPIDGVDLKNELAYLHLLEGRGPESLKLLAESQAESRRLGYPLGLGWALYYEGLVHNSLGNLPAAEKALREAVAGVEAYVQESGATPEARRYLVGRYRTTYDLLMDILVRQGKSAEALEEGMRAEALASLASLDLGQVRARDPQTHRALQHLEARRERTRELSEQLSAASSRPADQQDAARVNQLQGELASNKAQFHQVLNQLEKQDPAYASLVAIRPSSFARLQPKLAPDTLLVAYYPAEKKLYLFVATREALRIQAVDLPRSELEALVRTARQALVQPGPQGLSPQGRQALSRLYQALVAPLEKELAGKSTLAVMPSAHLYYLPFAALGQEAGGKFQYLIERASVVVLTGLEALDLGPRPPVGSPRLVAFGDPAGDLPAAQAEVQELGALFPQKQIFLRQEATLDKALGIDPATTVVHFATHGVVDAEDVNRSFLLLAGQGEESKLTTGKIYGLSFPSVTLVALSACQTGLGPRTPTGEIGTLAQAFSVAGSRSMLASLWKVSDSGTRQLMLAFYKHLLGGKGKAEALRLAQLELLAQGELAHPFYWSAFELIGDWR